MNKKILTRHFKSYSVNEASLVFPLCSLSKGLCRSLSLKIMWYADCINNWLWYVWKIKEKLLYALYRTRLNPVQDSLYRRWQILLVNSHTRLYVIWYLDLLPVHVCVYIYKPPNILLKYCLMVCLLKFPFSPWHSSPFLNSATKRVFIWLQILGQHDSHLSTANLQMLVRFCASECESQ